MRKTAIILIVIGLVVVIGANLFLQSQPEPPLPVMRDDTTLRRTTGGEIVGFRDNGARAWMGIAYAAPPVGDNRWRAPKPPVRTTGVRETIAAGAMCPQLASPLSDAAPGSIAGNEDCLFLNVWSPPNAVDLPVMYWIHGGGNSIGDGASYNGATLAVSQQVVVVTINYRLGFLGWFSHPALATGNPLDDSGNYGTLDTIAGLQWVQDNIGEFGGDPNNVTVFGESAGAVDTLAIMASPLAEGLFHRAIVQSGGYNAQPLSYAQNYADNGGHPNSSQEMTAQLLVKDGTVANLAAAKRHQADLSDADLQTYLRGKTPAELFALFGPGGFGMINVPEIFRDGHVLPDLSTQEIFSDPDAHNRVPTILGTNRDEPSLFMMQDPAYTTLWLGFLPRLKDPALYQRQVKYGALAWKERGVDRLANYMTQAGNPSVYAYRFDWDEEPSQWGFDLSVALGAAHALEIAFVFGDFDSGMGRLGNIYPNDAGQRALSDSMMSYWTHFARTGNPATGTQGREVDWLAWGTEGQRMLILDTPTDQGIYMSDEEVTVASIKAALAADTGFTDPAAQCAVYARAFRGDQFNATEYAQLNSTCATLDPASLQGF